MLRSEKNLTKKGEMKFSSKYIDPCNCSHAKHDFHHNDSNHQEETKNFNFDALDEGETPLRVKKIKEQSENFSLSKSKTGALSVEQFLSI